MCPFSRVLPPPVPFIVGETVLANNAFMLNLNISLPMQLATFVAGNCMLYTEAFVSSSQNCHVDHDGGRSVYAYCRRWHGLSPAGRCRQPGQVVGAVSAQEIGEKRDAVKPIQYRRLLPPRWQSQWFGRESQQGKPLHSNTSGPLSH